MTTTRENLGPAERILQTILTYSDHLYHGRPGAVVAAPGPTGVRWEAGTHRLEADQKIIYKTEKVGRKSNRTRLGWLRADHKIIDAQGGVYGEYRGAGLFPEVVAWLYQQVADVWQIDNEFVARWASFAYGQEHRDLKVVLAAFMLVQARKGDPVLDGGKLAFHDDDHRDVGEAMALITTKRKDKGPSTDFDAKMLLRIHAVLVLPQVAAINRALGFGQSARRPFLGRWPAVVEKWLRYREENPRLLAGLVKAGFRTTLMALAERVGYKPSTPYFFEVLRWKQAQAKDGRRELAIGQEVKAAETWATLGEAAICRKIVADKPSWKRIVTLVPKQVGVTRAIMSAAIEAGALSEKDLIIVTPTLEELGLLEVADVRARWEQAVKAATDMRAANVARNVQSKGVREQLQQAADGAIQKALEAPTRGLRIYFFIDISGSMDQSIEQAKRLLARFLQGFPAEQTHIFVFNTTGRLITLKQASAAGVENAFRGIRADGGTAHAAGVRAARPYPPKADEDVLFVFIGDEGERSTFEAEVRASALRPAAFGLVQLPGQNFNCVTGTAAVLGIPCFRVAEEMFADPYAVTRTIRALIAATPVGPVRAAAQAARLTLVDQILKTELLQKPAWAS